MTKDIKEKHTEFCTSARLVQYLFVDYKTNTMARHKGKPSGINKPKKTTGIPSNFTPDSTKQDEQQTQKYTEDDTRIAGHIRERNPNRNVDKEKATNAHGYKN